MTIIRILLTASERMTARRLNDLLTDARYVVDLAIDANRTKQLLERHSYDLLLIDFRLPGINGCGLCHQVKNKNEHLPVIIVSAGSNDHKFEAFQAGADDYFLLSDDFRELMLRIKALTRRSLQGIFRQDRISVGDIVMNLDSKEVFCCETEILLSAREFLLLQYLLQNKDRIVSPDEIVANLWGSTCNKKQVRVPAFMHSLRMKISNARSSEFIYTVRGKGYMLAES
jgi:two-component system, OmpR family, copper resistance phosphate regulon response regulator CusR